MASSTSSTGSHKSSGNSGARGSPGQDNSGSAESGELRSDSAPGQEADRPQEVEPAEGPETSPAKTRSS